MKDAQLSTSQYLPAAGGTNATGTIPMGIDGATIGGDAWRRGRIRATVPAMAAHTNPAQTITLTLQVAGANSAPLIQAQIPGVAITGTAAATIDFPLPPNLNGDVSFSQAVPAGGPAVQGVNITYDWVNV